MLIFIVPSWHPTLNKPNWCNWILPHIKVTGGIGKVVVLQVNLEAEKSEKEEISQHKNHFYLPCHLQYSRFTRTILGYGKVLNKYSTDLELLYNEAVSQYGKPDIIHAHVSMPAGYGASLLAKKYNIPVIVTEHYSGFFSDFRFPWRIGSFYKKMRENINGLYAVSPGFKNKIERLTKIKVDGITLNPINTELFTSNKKEKNTNKINFVSTGNFGNIKGTDILLEAFSKLDDNYNWHLTIVGKKSTIENEYWNDLILKLPNDRLTILEPVDQKILCKIYSTSDVFIMSSRMETANVSMLEAMSCGCYVITNKIEAPETLLNSEVSKVFVNTVKSLTKCIIETMDESLPNREFQRKYITDHFSNNILSKKLEKIYNFHI